MDAFTKTVPTKSEEIVLPPTNEDGGTGSSGSCVVCKEDTALPPMNEDGGTGSSGSCTLYTNARTSLLYDVDAETSGPGQGNSPKHKGSNQMITKPAIFTPSPHPSDLSIHPSQHWRHSPNTYWSSPEQRRACQHFHRTTTPIGGDLSCAWEECHFSRLFISDWGENLGGLSEVDTYLRLLNIPRPARPLAFLDSCEPLFLFEAGGRYYHMGLGPFCVADYGAIADWAGDNDFLARHADKGVRPPERNFSPKDCVY
ncbi:hypothetical protein DFH09DRAFT_1312541 [Mycena vulgaris]|nr:hypothetical protein DFH09DRAFT_1312541 [Mycena vulgaris]